MNVLFASTVDDINPQALPTNAAFVYKPGGPLLVVKTIVSNVTVYESNGTKT